MDIRGLIFRFDDTWGEVGVSDEGIADGAADSLSMFEVCIGDIGNDVEVVAGVGVEGGRDVPNFKKSRTQLRTEPNRTPNGRTQNEPNFEPNPGFSAEPNYCLEPNRTSQF